MLFRDLPGYPANSPDTTELGVIGASMRNCIIVLLAAFVTAPAYSSELPIGAMRFALGAEQSSVMQEVRARFHVVPLQGSSETFFLSETKPPNIRVLGSIRFANGRLSWVQRNWGQFEGKVNSTEVSKTLFAAIESATAEAGASATVSTKVQRVPGAEFRSIYFEFPGRKITVTSTDGDASHGGKQVSIEESIALKQ
jgi:hypothetical protein